MNGNIPRMDYRQYRAARRLVHECCNYDSGNCLLLEDGEPCVCVQSISYSLLCRWFTAAVLPLDEALEAALLRRGSRKRCAVCGAFFFPKSNRGKYCPDCAGRMKRINAAKRKRKQREKCHALGHFNPAGNRPIPHRKRVICAAVRPFHPFAEERLAGQRGTDIHCLPHSRDSGNAG